MTAHKVYKTNCPSPADKNDLCPRPVSDTQRFESVSATTNYVMLYLY